MNDPAKELFDTGLFWFGRGEMLKALPFLEKSFSLDPTNGICLSYLALLIGLERGQAQKGIELAKEAVAKAPGIPALYVNLAKLYNKTGKNAEAMDALRQSLKQGTSPEANALLNEMNPRMKPLFSCLARGNFLNRFAGKVLKKTGLRRFRTPGRRSKKLKTLKITLLARKGW